MRTTDNLIHVNEYPPEVGADACIALTIYGPANVQQFKELIQRGSNTGADLSASMKELADLVTSGKIMQDYSQFTPSKPGTNSTARADKNEKAEELAPDTKLGMTYSMYLERCAERGIEPISQAEYLRNIR